MAFWNRKPKQLAANTAVVPVARHDAWSNVLSGIGDRTRDKRMSSNLEVDIVADDEARAMWRGDFVAKRAIELLPKEAFRQGFVVKADKKEIGESIMARLEEIRAVPQLIKAAQYERAYGGAALFPVINDGNADLGQPLAEDGRISEISAIHVFEPRELSPQTWYENLHDVKFRQPKTYRLNAISAGGRASASEEIHESRLIIFRGVRVSEESSTGPMPGWGDNVLTCARQALADYGMTWGSAATLMHEFAQGVLSLDGLAELMAQDKGKLVIARLQMMDLVKSTLRTMVIDSKDTYERKQTPLSGLPEILREMMAPLAAAVDMPVTMLFGISPAGLNATGASDIAMWGDRCAAAQVEKYTTPVERLVQLVMLENGGATKGIELDEWSVEWNPMVRPTDQEREATRKTRAETDAIYIDKQVLTAGEVRDARFLGDTFSYDLQVTDDIDPPEPNPADVAALEVGRAKLREGEVLPVPGAKAAPDAKKRRAMIEEVLNAGTPGEKPAE